MSLKSNNPLRAFSKGPAAPENCGKRLLPLIVDERAHRQHARPLFSIHDTKSNTFQDVSYSQFANAVNKCASWILENVGRSESVETLAYLGPSDIRYQILILAAVKTGHVLFVPSPRNSTEAFQALLEESKAKVFLSASTSSATVAALIKDSPDLSMIVVPELLDWLTAEQAELVAFEKSWEECRFEPFVQIHTSGSTGIPKLITLKHGNFSALDAMQSAGGNEFGDRLGGLRYCCTFPPFHIAGIVYGLALPCFIDSTPIFPPLGPVTADVVDRIHVEASAQYSLLPPSLVIDLVKNPEYLRNLGKLKGVSFAGGPLPDRVGECVMQHTNLVAGWGSSEYLALPQLRKEKQDWAYFRFNELESGVEFQAMEDELFELVIIRRPELDLLQPVFITFPELQEFRTKDLFRRHPTKAYLWKYVGRSDDIIVFSNGEKLNPTTMEGIITSCPEVKGCLITGQGQFQASALIEPNDSSKSRAELMGSVWPYIQQANEVTVKHGRIAKDFIFFIDPSKPLERAAKGTIRRAASNKLYKTEIDAIYTSPAATPKTPKILEESSKTQGISSLTGFESVEAIEASLRSLIHDEADITINKVSDDFFSMGMDSLQLINLVRAVNVLRPDRPIDAKQIYDHPSVKQLAAYLHAKHNDIDEQAYDSDDGTTRTSWILMDSLYESFAAQAGRTKKRRQYLRSDDTGPVYQPDGGVVAWLQVLASFLININNWGLVNTFGVFQAYYESQLLQGHSQSAISWIGTLQGALLLIIGVISGPLFDRGYFRAVTTAASAGLIFAVMMLSVASSYYQVFLLQGVLSGICSGLLYIPSVALIPVYFKHKRGLALGLATSGGSLGGIIYPAIFQRLLTSVGFGWATRCIGFLAFGTLGVAAVIIKPLGPRAHRQLFDRRALTDKSYLAFSVAAFMVFAAILVPFFLATSYAVDSLSAGPSARDSVLSVLNIGQLFGRLLPSISSDYNHRFLGPEALLFFAEFGAGILGFFWLTVDNVGGFVVWLLAYGFVSGMTATLPALVLPYLCPNLATYGTRLGMVYACAGFGVLISTPIAAALNERTGDFKGSMCWIGTACIIGALCFATAGWQARSRRLLYELGNHRAKSRRARQSKRHIKQLSLDSTEA